MQSMLQEVWEMLTIKVYTLIFENQGRTNIQFCPTSFHFKEAAIKSGKAFQAIDYRKT